MAGDDEQAIRKVVDTWMTANQAGDIDTVLGLMTDDVVFMVPGHEAFGKEAFAAAANSLKGMRIEGRNDIREIKVLGDWAYLRNHRHRDAPARRGHNSGASRGTPIC